MRDARPGIDRQRRPYASPLSGHARSNTSDTVHAEQLDEHHTRVFTLQLWQIAQELGRRSGDVIEEEQPERAFPEPDPIARRFEELTVRNWDEWLAYRETGESEAARAEQVRVEVL